MQIIIDGARRVGAPGEHFGIGRYIRIGFGYDIELTKKGLRRIDSLLKELREKRAARKR